MSPTLTSNPLTSKTATIRKRRVRFAPMVSVSTANTVPPSVAERIWYGNADLAKFKLSAKKAATSLRLGVPCDDVRGVEGCTSARQERRYLAVRCTLSAHRRGLSANATAVVSQRCTEWNARVAVVQARHDFAEIYHPDLFRLLPRVEITPPRFPFVFTESKAKRRRAAVDEDGVHPRASAGAGSGTETRRRIQRRVCE